MITSSREAAFTAKQEDKASDTKISKASSSSTSWSRLKDPRIVRVSRAFGGKDRHSKVSTVRGLRDRRIRLSVPTAIQLYDLQDRLGLNQPSKVVDWLLNVAKHEINELPPLQMPPGNFAQSHQTVLTASHGVGASQSDKSEGIKINSSSINWDDPLELSTTNYWSSETTNLRDMKSKEIVEETANDKESWAKRNQAGKPGDLEGHDTYISSSNFFPRANHCSLTGLLNNVMPQNSFLRWDPSNLSLSHLGSHGLTPQTEDLHNFNFVPSGSQVLVYPPGATQSCFPLHVNAAGEFDPKQINFQMLSSSSQNPSLLNSFSTPPLYTISQAMRPFHLNMNPKLFPSSNDSGSAPTKDD